ISFQNEPSYFAAARIGSQLTQTIVVRDTASRGDAEIVGMATRSVRNAWVNGTSMDIGYLSSLRLKPEVRSTRILARGYQFLKELHETDHRVPWYYTSIISDNIPAIRTLTSGRAGLPHYRHAGSYW